MRNLGAFLMVMTVPAVALGQQATMVKGSICGSVLDENGLPASHVRLVAMIRSPGGHSGFYPSSTTDDVGHYCIDDLPLGEYILSADDEAKGYPQRGPQFFLWQSPDPKVVLTQEHPHENADWQIPFKAGTLKIELPQMAADGPSGLIRLFFHVRLRSEEAILFSEVPAGFSEHSLTYLLPPDEDVALVVTCADGHKWPDDSGAGKLLLVHAGETGHVELPAWCLKKQ